jgi:hypothetical protein
VIERWQMRIEWLAAGVGLLALLLFAGCGVTMQVTLHRRPCADGLPARLLLDVHCPQGICGSSCAPNRWDSPGCP